jgi:hypothetical protein
MRIKKSVYFDEMIGFFWKNEDGNDEEIMSVHTIESAQKIVENLQKDINKLKNEQEGKK